MFRWANVSILADSDDFEVCAPIELAAFRRFVGGYRLGLAVSLETQPLRRDARLDQIIIYGPGTVFRQLLVISLGTGAVGMAADFDQHLFIQIKEAGKLIKVALGLGQQGVSIGFEENVAQCL